MIPGQHGWPPGISGQLIELFFDAPGTYQFVKQRNLLLLYYRLVAGGGGGASGAIGATGTARAGGAGGSGGQAIEGWLLGSDIPDSGEIIVPAGGAGGSGSAQVGSNGGDASFCGVLFASRGLGQAASGGWLYDGRPAAFRGDSSSNGQGGLEYGRCGGLGGNQGVGGDAIGSGVHPGGGGGGGGGAATNASTNGGRGGRGFSRRKLAATGVNIQPLVDNQGTTAGVQPSAGVYGTGDGGGGGAYRSGFSSVGGDGGWPGGAGGGAGAADTGQTSVGGNGAGGMVRLWLWVPT